MQPERRIASRILEVKGEGKIILFRDLYTSPYLTNLPYFLFISSYHSYLRVRFLWNIWLFLGRFCIRTDSNFMLLQVFFLKQFTFIWWPFQKFGGASWILQECRSLCVHWQKESPLYVALTYPSLDDRRQSSNNYWENDVNPLNFVSVWLVLVENWYFLI